jgi:Protein of unknown function (DUF2510)
VNAPPPLPSGWFPDPHERHEYRWFNGTAWTADVADEGQRLIDPHGAAPLARNARPAAADGDGNGVAVAALTCGLVALVFAWMPLFVVIGITLGVLGLVLGVKGRRRARLVGSGRGLALTGLISGIAALVLSVLGVVLTVSLMGAVIDFIHPGPYDAEVVSCEMNPGEIDVKASLTNRSDALRSYTLYGVVSQPSGIPDLVAHLDDVEPGATRAVTLSRISSAPSDAGCEARLVVHGPSPWGIDVERVND